ncbi:microtubule-associated protein [Vigna angularis]|uniref:Microtubule-associated protein n=1 Tax=Phaseolus angularis TaxID=3914 RepID=A0A8T0KAJ1_PHAAN|nr:microtubule-associated protein [Vigna angularis]
MAATPPSFSPSRTTCASLLRELQMIWDEIGESDNDRDNMLLQLEQECLDIYHRRVEETRMHKADMYQWLADAEAQAANLVSSLGESTVLPRGKGSLKQQIATIRPVLEDLRSKKDERIKEFLKIKSQISQICDEIAGCGQYKSVTDSDVNQSDLSSKKLGELKSHLQELQNEKILRQQKVKSHISTISELTEVMSIDFMKTLNEIHPSLDDSLKGTLQSISNDTLARLTGVIHSLKREKQQRLQKDENRYSAVRGAHKNLKRAEKARILVSKIPSAIVENLTARVKAWEMEKGIPFLYEKIPLLHSLDEYIVQRRLREEEKRKHREQKRLQEQAAVEQEALFGSRSATKKPLCQSNNANTIAGTPTGRRLLTPSGRHGTSGGKERRESGRQSEPHNSSELCCSSKR